MGSIKAGDLRIRITLLKPSDAADSDRRRGVLYTEVCEVSAAKSDVSGREFYQAHAVHLEDVVTYTIRYREDITSQWRVRHAGVEYNILEVNHLGYMRDFLRLKCRNVRPGGV